MKSFCRILAICLCALLLSSCNIVRDNEQVNIEKSTVENGMPTNIPNEDNNSYEGTYQYDYIDDTEDLIEDHYIVLRRVEGKLEGIYYGTSDDFDQAREGYFPGFYVSNMIGLSINKSEIAFDIKLKQSDLFSKPIELKYRSSEEVSKSDNLIWVNSHIVEGSDKNAKHFQGEIADEEIRLLIDGELRIFKKIK